MLQLISIKPPEDIEKLSLEHYKNYSGPKSIQLRSEHSILETSLWSELLTLSSHNWHVPHMRNSGYR